MYVCVKQYFTYFHSCSNLCRERPDLESGWTDSLFSPLSVYAHYARGAPRVLVVGQSVCVYVCLYVCLHVCVSLLTWMG